MEIIIDDSIRLFEILAEEKKASFIVMGMKGAGNSVN
jgi:hypothetical protein